MCQTEPSPHAATAGELAPPDRADAPAPIVQGEPVEVSEGVFVIPDNRVPIVPNVGIVQLLALDPAVVVPGHGEVSDATLIRDVRDYLAHVRTEATRLRDRGTTEDEAAERISDSARSRWSTWEHLGAPRMDKLRRAGLLQRSLSRLISARRASTAGQAP